MTTTTSGGLVSKESTIAGGLRLIAKKYPAGFEMPRHEHGEWRYCLAIRGSYTDTWKGTQRTRTASQLSLHPASELHSTRFHVDSTCFHIEYTCQWRDRLLDQAGIPQEPLEFLAGRVPLIAGQLYQEFRRTDGCSSLVVEGLACELAGWSARSASTGEPAPQWVRQARELLHDSFQSSLDLESIAATFQVHPVHLARQFKRAFGWTIGDYVRRLRVEFVCEQLESGEPLSDLALRAGFSDQSHLTRIFKRFTGLTPGQYRAKR